MPPKTDQDVPLTSGTLLRWGGAVTAVCVFIFGIGTAYAAVHFRLGALELRVTAVESSTKGSHEDFEKLSKRIGRIDRKLALLVCKSDPARCSEQELAGTDEP